LILIVSKIMSGAASDVQIWCLLLDKVCGAGVTGHLHVAVEALAIHPFDMISQSRAVEVPCRVSLTFVPL
jgi:hypothetical protein